VCTILRVVDNDTHGRRKVNPVEMLQLMGDKLPGPMKTAFDKALELAAFAPLLPLAEKMKSKDLQGAVALVMSGPMMKAVAAINTEMPRTLLKNLLTNAEMEAAIQQAMARMPTNLHSPFIGLQQLVLQLDGDVDALVQRFQEVAASFKVFDVPNADFKFPHDLIKEINPVGVLSAIAQKLPGPMRTIFEKGLEAAAFKPLMPLVEKVKSKDLKGATALMMSMPMLKAIECLDAEMPRTLLKKFLHDDAVVSSVKSIMEEMPKQLQPPLEMLLEFSNHLDDEIGEVMENCESVFQNFVDYAHVYSQPQVNFRFPQSLLEKMDVAGMLQVIADKVPAPLDKAFVTAVGGIVTIVTPSLLPFADRQ